MRIVGGSGATTSISTVSSEIPSVATVKLPLDQVWQVLPSVFEAIPIKIEQLDQRTRVIGNPNLKLRGRLGKVQLSRYIDCGSAQGGPSADSYDVLLSVVTQAQAADPASTTVSTIVQAVARPINFSGDYMRCSTTGGLEAHISKLLNERLAKP
ncbi:MAG: hypothetical protein ACT4O1_08510 [Gemmatimonadota bacterium]